MPLLTYNGRSVFVDATCYAEVVSAAKRVFFASSGIPPPRLRFRLGWPLGSFTQDLATTLGRLQIEGPLAADLRRGRAAGAPDGHDAAGAQQMLQGLPTPADTDNIGAGVPAAAASPTPTLINLDETDDDLLKETSTAIKYAKGKVLFRAPYVEDGYITFDDIFKTAESFLNVSCSSLLLRMEGTILGYVHGYGNHPRHENVILDAGATILDLRRKLTAEDSGVYSWVNIDDVFILPATSPSQSAEYNDPLEDDTTLASCRKAGHPLIHLNASTRKAEALRKEEETRAAKKRKIIAKLAGLIVRDEAAREDDEY
uniref:Uncharacterized protein n=1 Tax=Rhodotorula toruloides TaxID=5286 RepID=A0A0K3CBA7_RHOTO